MSARTQALLGEAILENGGLRSLPRADDDAATAQAPAHPVDADVPGAAEASASADYEREAELYAAWPHLRRDRPHLRRH